MTTMFECQLCHAPTSAEEVRDRPAWKCRLCGGSSLLARVVFHETVTAHERLDVKAREAGARKAWMEQRIGHDFHRASGTWRKIRRVIDRKNNRYAERVEQMDGGVVRDVDVPLDEHRGHGSDRTSPKAHP